MLQVSRQEFCRKVEEHQHQLSDRIMRRGSYDVAEYMRVDGEVVARAIYHADGVRDYLTSL
jgi:hypothetical protein